MSESIGGKVDGPARDSPHPNAPHRNAPHRGAPIGPGRVIALCYAFFTVAAGARSGVQLATEFSEARLAYLLSALAAVIYAAATVLIFLSDIRARPGLLRATHRLCVLELAGVAVIGATSVIVPSAFPQSTVWSGFGSGYGFVPLVLPVVALFWLHRRRGGVDAAHPSAEAAAQAA